MVSTLVSANSNLFSSTCDGNSYTLLSSSTMTPPSSSITLPALPSSSGRRGRVSAATANAISSPAGPKPTRLACSWREIQGSRNWEKLVEPLCPLLKKEIIRYGEFANVCYRAFDQDPRSRFCFNCKYGKRTILREVGLAACTGYVVTKYLYATPDLTSIPTQAAAPVCSRWIGYVAVSSDEEVAALGRRDILVAFRGTVTGAEWLANLMSSLIPARLDPHQPSLDVKVESGFLGLYTTGDRTCRFSSGSCREQVLREVSRLLNEHKHEEVSVTLTGHSMGSSLALLLGYDLAELGLNRDASGREVPVSVYSFAGPRVGNLAFKERCDDLGVKVLRVVNVNDAVTKIPGIIFNESFWGGKLYELPWSYDCYTHVGVELALDFSSFNDPVTAHDLDQYIGLLRCSTEEEVEEEEEEVRRREEKKREEEEGEDIVEKARRFVGAQKIASWA